jgi:hypothetical protein
MARTSTSTGAGVTDAARERVAYVSGRRRRLTAALLVLAVVLANVAFLGLGSIFDYPDVLQRPVDEILVAFRADEAQIVGLFVVLALSAALLAPIAVLLGRMAGNELGRWSIGVGIPAAVVQVVGLLRWPLVVPFLADGHDTSAFETVHTMLGTVVGETFGYLLTATWTVMIVVVLGRRLAGRWFSLLGIAAAALVGVGVLVPLDVPGTDLANFVGYIVWSLWLLVLAVLVWGRVHDEAEPAPSSRPSTSTS